MFVSVRPQLTPSQGSAYALGLAHRQYLLSNSTITTPTYSCTAVNDLRRPPIHQSFKMPGIVSATGVLAFLTDEEPELKVFALQTLNDDIDTVWTEVAAVLTQMYVMLAFLF